jgi:hypothetical protein
MALNIRDPRARELAHEVAQTTGESMTEAVVTALAELLARLRTERHPAGRNAPRAFWHMAGPLRRFPLSIRARSTRFSPTTR